VRGRERFFDFSLNYENNNCYMNNITNTNFDSKYACYEEMLIEITLILSISDNDNENGC
jgi:hypothetical protein